MNCSRSFAVSRSLLRDSVAFARASTSSRSSRRRSVALITTRRVYSSIPSGGALLDCVGYHSKPFAAYGHEVEGELVEEALHPQQRRDVRFVVDAAGHIEKLVDALAGEVTVRITSPGAQCLVDRGDAPVGRKNEIAAGSVLEQVLEVFRSGLGT